MLNGYSVVDNINRILKHYDLEDSVVFTEVQEDRAKGWPIGTTLRDFLVANNWTMQPDKVTALFHGEGESYREPGAVHPAMQVVLHPSLSWHFGYRDNEQAAPYWAEIDIDMWNPKGGDVASLIGHVLEVVHNEITGEVTNQAIIAKLLDRRFA